MWLLYNTLRCEVLSASSTCRSAEGIPVRQPGRNRIRRHTKRLSGVFFHGPASGSGPMALNSSLRSSLSLQTRKGSVSSSEILMADDPSELSNHITAPGILKIFGNEICEGAHYKSVLATMNSSAKELVKEALERYGLGKDEAGSYVLCDTIGSLGGHQWRTEGFRVVGDHEKPLLLQSLWKPREGLARRFEIQKRSRVEEKRSREQDTVTAGINAQARKLQKSRSRVTSTLIERTTGRTHKLWRSKSEMDLLDPDDEHTGGQSESPASDQGSRRAPQPARTETLCSPRQGEESEREETESSDDNTTQYSIHPPHDCPYLLLLQGHSPTKDFIIYLLAGPDTVMGRRSDQEEGPNVDVRLFAADILPRHCCFSRRSIGGPAVLRPCRNAMVTRNGEVTRSEVSLDAGDVIGLGQHYLFLFKDPLVCTLKAPELSLPNPPWMFSHHTTPPAMSHTGEKFTCTDFLGPNCNQLPEREPPCFRSPDGCSLTLKYLVDDEDHLPPLTTSFLLCTCLQYSSACLRPSDLRKLLLIIAGGVQSEIWELSSDLAAVQRGVLNHDRSEPDRVQPLSLQEAVSGLRPLVVWMSNSLELLQFIQHQLPLILEWRADRDQGQEQDADEREEVENLAPLELRLSRVRSASEEATAVLEKVIMLTFQQCVYYVTKVLYPILPGLLDCNPFKDGPPDPRMAGKGGGPRVPEGIQQVVEVLTQSWTLLSDCQVHPEVSSQLAGYLFYFINASLFNTLMDRGSDPGFYQWSRGVRMRANLDLLLDWAHAAGLEELASERTHALSSAINLLAMPRKNLLQMSWTTLRSSYPALTPAQLNHLLTLYSPASPCTHTWSPSVTDHAAAHDTDDILENFDTHHPLVLPHLGYQLQLRSPVSDSALREELETLKEFISTISVPNFSVRATGEQQLPPPSSLLTCCPGNFTSCGGHMLLHKLRELELQTRETETGEVRWSGLDPSCLLSPANTPHTTHPVPDPVEKADGEMLAWPSAVGGQDEAGLALQCLSALKGDGVKSDCSSMKTLMEVKEEEDVEEAGDHYDNMNDEVFSLELQKGERGLGLALVDTRDTSLKMEGIFISAVLPDSPAARSKQLVPGDRILAVNGVSLLGLDYQSGRELIQSSGARLKLLVARSAWMAKTIQS
ncbi:ras-associating and dilute domain-containing protein-like [Pholidichthys leucotaenia]